MKCDEMRWKDSEGEDEWVPQLYAAVGFRNYVTHTHTHNLSEESALDSVYLPSPDVASQLKNSGKMNASEIYTILSTQNTKSIPGIQYKMTPMAWRHVCRQEYAWTRRIACYTIILLQVTAPSTCLGSHWHCVRGIHLQKDSILKS